MTPVSAAPSLPASQFTVCTSRCTLESRRTVRKLSFAYGQRKRDDNKNKICTFRGGAERKIVQNALFHGKRHDNKILKVKI